MPSKTAPNYPRTAAADIVARARKAVAEVNRWQYTPDTAKGGKYGDLKVAKVDYKQIPFGHGGLKTMRDMKG